MRPADDIYKMINKLHVKASAELDRRVHNDISESLAKNEQIYPARTEPNISRSITKEMIAKLAIAAVICIAFGTGFLTGRWSKPTQLATTLPNVTDYTLIVPGHPTAFKTEDSFWRQKALTVMQPRPYAQSHFDKTSLLNAYKQYLKEKQYD